MNDLISTLKEFWKTAKWLFLILLAVIATMACFNYAYQTDGNGFYWFVGIVNACVYFFAIYRGWKAENEERK